ncbi:MAG: GNAT family N-acetyltransferase [Eubacteriales bacterium]
MFLTAINDENRSFFQPFILPEYLENPLPYAMVGLIDDETACGAIVGLIEDHVLQIYSLYVAPSARRKGGGTMLFNGLRDCAPKLFSIVVQFIAIEPEHQTLPPFFESLGMASSDSIGTQYSTTVGHIQTQPFFQREHSSTPENILPFSQVSSILQRQTLHQLSIPIQEDILEEDISLLIQSGTTIKGAMLFTKERPDYLVLSMVEVDADYRRQLPLLFWAGFHRLIKAYPPETMIVVQPLTTTAEELTNAVLGPMTPITQCWRMAATQHAQ